MKMISLLYVNTGVYSVANVYSSAWEYPQMQEHFIHKVV